ncbi:MAG TPA: Gfo/Idh/MocA family oxidoreductase [Stellaceae bacterium]|nr:Gfo/Idh/MocA family oxidoreductase [Stellaceae bacterium]
MIEAAVVGLGRWGRTLVASVQGKSERLHFSCAVVRAPKAHRDFARESGLELVSDLAAALREPAIDAVVLATPHSQHLGQILAAAAAHKAVFCEKPLTLTKPDAERAIAACAAAGVVLGVGTDKRFFPAMEELTRIVNAGELGPLLHLEANFSNEVSAAMPSGWRHDPRESPAGGLTATGIHVLDALVRLAGPVRRVEAQLISLKPPPDPHDSLSVLLEFENGVSGILAAVRSTPAFWRVHAFGRRGSAETRGRIELILRRSGAEPRQLSFPERDSVRANLEAFADAVAGIAPYPIRANEILATVAAFEAITKSLA